MSVRNKINGGFGVDSGAMESPYELNFSVYHRIRTLAVDEDIELGLSSDPDDLISYTFETLVTTGDDSHQLTFPEEWIAGGDAFDNTKLQRIVFMYDGTYVEYIISTLGDVPDATAPTLVSATMNGSSSQTLDLVFDEAVTITTSGWSVSASGGAVTVSSVASGDGTTTPKFTLSRSIGGSETLTVSYNPATGATTDATGNELGTVSGQSVTNNAYIISLEVLFTGTSLDTGKGTLTNPDSSNLLISQNGKLLFTRSTDTNVASSITNYWNSVNTYTRGAFSVLMNHDTGFAASTKVFQYRVDANNDITILSTAAAAGNATIRVRSGGSTTYTADTGISLNNRFKIEYDASNNIKFYYWNSSTWTQLGVTQTVDIGSAGNIRLSTSSNSADAASDVFSFDSLYVTDKNYTTVTP